MNAKIYKGLRIVTNNINTCDIWLLESNIYTFPDLHVLVHTCYNNARNFHA